VAFSFKKSCRLLLMMIYNTEAAAWGLRYGYKIYSLDLVFGIE
jgi:hypothetical protein